MPVKPVVTGLLNYHQWPYVAPSPSAQQSVRALIDRYEYARCRFSEHIMTEIRRLSPRLIFVQDQASIANPTHSTSLEAVQERT